MPPTLRAEVLLSDRPQGRGAGNVPGMETKRCTKCHEAKPVEEFELIRQGPYRRGTCRACMRPIKTKQEAARRGEQRTADPAGFKASKAAEATARRKRLRLEQLADVVRLVEALRADGRSVEAAAEALLAADVRVYGDLGS